MSKSSGAAIGAAIGGVVGICVAGVLWRPAVEREACSAKSFAPLVPPPSMRYACSGHAVTIDEAAHTMAIGNFGDGPPIRLTSRQPCFVYEGNSQTIRTDFPGLVGRRVRIATDVSINVLDGNLMVASVWSAVADGDRWVGSGSVPLPHDSLMCASKTL